MTASTEAAAELTMAPNDWWRRIALVAAIIVVPSLLVARYGLHEAIQATVNGVVSGSYYSIGAVGLTLLYGVLHLMNFAWGDYMTLGAYLTVPVTAIGAPFIVAAAAGMIGTGAAALILELIVWVRCGAAEVRLQTILAGIGVAFIMRYSIQIVAGPQLRSLGVNVTSSFEFAGLRIGRTQLLVCVIGYGVLAGLALAFEVLLDRQTAASTFGFSRARRRDWARYGAFDLRDSIYCRSSGGTRRDSSWRRSGRHNPTAWLHDSAVHLCGRDHGGRGQRIRRSRRRTHPRTDWRVVEGRFRASMAVDCRVHSPHRRDADSTGGDLPEQDLNRSRSCSPPQSPRRTSGSTRG